MFEDLENGVGLDIVVAVQENSSRFLDTLAMLLHQIGGDLGYLLLLPIIYWSINRGLGRQLLFVLVIALIGLLGMKELLDRPRPFVLHPDIVTPLFDEDGFGLPSGHVVLSLVIWGFVAYHARRWWAWLLVAMWVLLIGWSRIYAGVHYPQDVVVGILWGSLLLAISLALVPSAARWWNAAGIPVRLAFIFAATLVIAVLLQGDDTGLSTAGIILGGGIGLTLEERRLRFSSRGSGVQRITRSAIGLVLAMVIFFGMRFVFDGLTPESIWRILRYALVTWTLLFVWPWLSISAGLTTREPLTTPVR